MCYEKEMGFLGCRVLVQEEIGGGIRTEDAQCTITEKETLG